MGLFNVWLEDRRPDPTNSIKADIPIEQEVFTLASLLNGELYAVGGAVRDYLLYKFSRETSYNPKDVDLTTPLSEEEILDRLRSPQAATMGIKASEKEDAMGLNTFGVVFVYINGKNYEIAPFRKDIGSADGRRPERTERADILEDAKRRDFTVNNLYYDIYEKVILDFNPNGIGIEDAKNGKARTVGDPFARFDEDRLRVLRMIRVHAKMNTTPLFTTLLSGDRQDHRTLEAIEFYKDLPGISDERVSGEFIAAITNKKSNTSAVLDDYSNFKLFDRVFPFSKGKGVNTEGISKIGNIKNVKVILAWLLKDYDSLENKLLKLKYPSAISYPVSFLVSALRLTADNVFKLVKTRDKYLLGGNAGNPEEIAARNLEISGATKEDLLLLGQVVGDYEISKKLTHFSDYQPPQEASGEFLLKQGLKGPIIGQEQARVTASHYHKSYEDFKRRSSEDTSPPR